MFNSVKLTVILFFCICFTAQALEASKDIIIDLNKSKDDQEISTNIAKEDLSNFIILTNIGPNNTKANITFSGINFNVDSGAILAALEDDTANQKVKIPLTLIQDVNIPANSPYQYKISYSGSNSNRPPIFGNSNEVTFELTVVEQKGSKESNADTPRFSELQIQQAAINYVKSKKDPKKYYSPKTNLYLKDNTVFIFIDENGNLIYTGIPTTAKESYVYQLYLLVAEGSEPNPTFKFNYTGEFQPEFNIEKTTEEKTSLNAAEAQQSSPKIVEIAYPKIGPFTDSFTIQLTKSVEGKETETLLDHRIQVAKLYHVSISTGLFKTTLRNPQNIEKMSLANGTDTTLVADDPGLRGVVTVMATYYPNGRSLLFPPAGGPFSPSRLGIQVGAQLNDELSENFFLGLSHDFARGGTISYGLHCGRRNYVAGKKDFDFGKDLFDLPDLKVKKEWQVGFYFGVVIDSRVAVQLLKSLGSD